MSAVRHYMNPETRQVFRYKTKSSAAVPVVVIDPEDRDDVQRVCDALYANGSRRFGVELDWLDVQDALRSLIEPPAPPRPPEPTGLGAVVEDEDGKLWIRTADTDCACPWARASAYEEVDYDQIEAIKVLSEGVTP